MTGERSTIFNPDPPPPSLEREAAEWIMRQLYRISGNTQIIETVQKEQDAGLKDHVDNINNPHQTRHAQLPDVTFPTVLHNPHGMMRWSGDWSAGTYETFDTVTHERGLWVANKQTTEEPDFDKGTEGWISESIGTPAPTRRESLENSWVTGQRYKILSGGLISAYRVIVPAFSNNTQFSVWIRFYPGEAFETLEQILSPFSGSTDEQVLEFPWNRTIPSDTVFDMLLVASSVTQPNVINATWAWKNVNGDPSSEEANFQNSQTEQRIHVTPKSGNTTGINEGAANGGMTGGTISFGGDTWGILNSSDNGSHIRLTVPNQGRPDENDYATTITWGSTDPIPYMQEDNYFASDPEITGLSGATLLTLQETEHLYGIDIYGVELIPPDDWDLLAFGG